MMKARNMIKTWKGQSEIPVRLEPVSDYLRPIPATITPTTTAERA